MESSLPLTQNSIKELGKDEDGLERKIVTSPSTKSS